MYTMTPSVIDTVARYTFTTHVNRNFITSGYMVMHTIYLLCFIVYFDLIILFNSSTILFYAKILAVKTETLRVNVIKRNYSTV